MHHERLQASRGDEFCIELVRLGLRTSSTFRFTPHADPDIRVKDIASTDAGHPIVVTVIPSNRAAQSNSEDGWKAFGAAITNSKPSRAEAQIQAWGGVDRHPQETDLRLPPIR